jgi:hypothetical protein
MLPPIVATTLIVVGPLGTAIVQSRENLNSQPNWMISVKINPILYHQNQPHSSPNLPCPNHKKPHTHQIVHETLKIWKDFELKKVSGAEKIQLPSQFRLNNLGDG